MSDSITDKSLSRRDVLKVFGGGLTTFIGLKLGLDKLAQKSNKNAVEAELNLNPEYVAKVVQAEANLPLKVKEKYNLPFVGASFAVQCRGTTLSNFVLANQSDDSNRLAIYTDLGGSNIAELTCSPVRNTPQIEWKIGGSGPTEAPVLAYEFTKESVAEHKVVEFHYTPPKGQAEKIGWSSDREQNFHFSSNVLPEVVQKQLGLI